MALDDRLETNTEKLSDLLRATGSRNPVVDSILLSDSCDADAHSDGHGDHSDHTDQRD